jgi:RNA polymerase sigma-32 factor
MVDHLGSERSLDRYVSEINKYPLLTREEEILLAKCYCESGSQDAAHKLMVANLRFVVKTAHQYRGYGLKILDLVQEGNMGLMIAVKKFDPSRGYRLVSYAVWWIRAYIQSFIMRAWSQVKVGTTQAQRKLFFRVRSERQRADRAAGPGEHATPQQIGARLNVSALEVANMEARLGERDFSLDAQVVEGGRSCHVDMLASSGDSQEELYAGAELRQLLRCKVNETMESLNPKERYVITHRILQDEPPTLQEIGKKLHISRERVRQIEGNVIRKIGHAMQQPGAAARGCAAVRSRTTASNCVIAQAAP